MPLSGGALISNGISGTDGSATNYPSPQPGPMCHCLYDGRTKQRAQIRAWLTQADSFKERPADRESATNKIVQPNAACDDIAAERTWR
jgi:hypothetical protein